MVSMSSSASKSSSQPRQNPVFMFQPSGGKGHGTRTVFSVPGSTADENSRASILKENLVIHSSPSTSSSPKKGRGRHPAGHAQENAIFRLPTEEEEAAAIEKHKNGEGASSLSVSKGDENMDTSSSSPMIRSSPGGHLRRRSLDSKPANLAVIMRLFMLGQDEIGLGPSNKSPKEISAAEMNKCVRWIRTQGPELFWSVIHKNGTKAHEEWKCFESIHCASSGTALKFMNALEKVMKPGDYFQTMGQNKLNAPMQYLRKIMTGVLLGSDKQLGIPSKLMDEILEKFYTYGIRASMKVNVRNSDAMEVDMELDGENCDGCLDSPCICAKITSCFEEANLALQGLGLMDELAGPRLYAVMKRDMTNKITEIGTNQVDVAHLGDLLDWLEKRSAVWIETLYPRLKTKESTQSTEIKNKLKDNLIQMMQEQYGKSIINDLFPVIIEFPDSQPLLDDLKQCMKQVDLRNHLVTTLKSSLERRLLNAGVNTSEVLEAYIATVRALKYVDPSGILVQLVTPPVREYLKHREETVRVILVSLTEESGELSEELARNPSNVDKSSKITIENLKEWNPDPIDVPKDKNNLRKSDLIETLVSIYGSKSVFIDEYRALLADRLLRLPKPGSITREIKCLELLKLRFGESDLQKCEVMLKDVSDSQRLNTRFYEEEGAVLAKEATHVTGLIVSAQFWPSFKQEEIELPAPVKAALEKYTKAFEMIKGNRTLEWQKHIGTVELEIEHGGSLLTFLVTPIQATIIWHFQEQEKWTLEELAKVIGTTTTYLSNRIGYWVSKGIISHAGLGTYVLVDTISESSKATGIIPNKYMEEADGDSPMASTSSQRATELQVFWSYIEAMLTNLESLPLARIHSMLKLFATVECSSDELQKFLDDKVSQNLLIYSAGQYQLPK